MRTQLLTLVLVTMVGTTALAGDKRDSGKHGKNRRHVFCPHCGDPCYPTVTKGKETKHSWDVEAKTICIPKVRFPWEKDCGKKSGGGNCPAPKCGRTKCVNVLMKYEYECSTCKYSWDVDSYKRSKANKVPSEATPADSAPAAPEPPVREASLPRTTRRVTPASFEQQGTNMQPPKQSLHRIDAPALR
jgi:hypothetical protein